MTPCPDGNLLSIMAIYYKGTVWSIQKHDSQSLTDDVKLTYLKKLVTVKAKIAIAEFAYCVLMYKDALRTLERKFGQPQAVASAHLDKLSNFPPLKKHNSIIIINYSSAISSSLGFSSHYHMMLT